MIQIHLHWTHIIISNAKAFINGTFHGLDSIHLQRYLNEFCYRLNRRWNKNIQVPIRTSILTSNDELKRVAETAIAKVERNEAFSEADLNTFQQLLASLYYKVSTNPTEETENVLLMIKILLTYWMK